MYQYKMSWIHDYHSCSCLLEGDSSIIIAVKQQDMRDKGTMESYFAFISSQARLYCRVKLP